MSKGSKFQDSKIKKVKWVLEFTVFGWILSSGNSLDQRISIFSHLPWQELVLKKIRVGEEKITEIILKIKKLKIPFLFLNFQTNFWKFQMTYFSFIAVFLTGQRLRVRKSAMG